MVQFGLVAAPNPAHAGDHRHPDALVPAANASILACRMPRAQIHRVRGGGHLCLLDRAAEVGPIVSAFLRSLERTAINEVAELG